MKRILLWLVLLSLLAPRPVAAHLGNPDVFYGGMAGPYPVRVTIRMPVVVPGRAEIIVGIQSAENVQVDFAPIASETAATNAPPPEMARAVPGQTNLFSGELWLMTDGAYSINVRVRGPSGEGTVPVPVNSVATKQLPLPGWLGEVLMALGLLLVCGAVAIIGAAAGESVLPPGVLPGKTARRRYWIAAGVTTAVFTAGLAGGKVWWNDDEKNFRSRLVEGGWPDLDAEVRLDNSRRILSLHVGREDFAESKKLELARDHGKLMHTFLMRLPNHDVFAHLHPSHAEGKTYETPLPPLPEGDYEVLCDLTFSSTGYSTTATNTVHIPTASANPTAGRPVHADPDDSWTADASIAAADGAGNDVACRLADGTQVIWKAHPALRSRQDAGLRFEVSDSAGRPVAVEPYMGMMSHVAVLSSDGRIFAHLHPSGNYSMAAQMFFTDKMRREIPNADKGAGSNTDVFCGLGGSMAAMTTLAAASGAPSVITLPYEFPSAGQYRLWVQIKTGGRVQTAIFDTTVL